MSQEAIMKVLKMVEEGKISADDAQKLIAEINLASTETRDSTCGSGKEKSISDMIGGVIGTALQTAETAIRNATDSVNGMFGSHEEEIPVKGRNIVIVSAGSNLDIKAEDIDNMKVSISGLKPKIMNSDDEVKVKVTAASGEIVIPKNSTVKLKLDGTNCDIATDGGHYIVNSAGSSLNIDTSKGINNMKGNLTACKLDLFFSKKCSARINSKSGTVNYPDGEVLFTETGNEVFFGESPFVIDIDSTAGTCEIDLKEACVISEVDEKKVNKTLKKEQKGSGKKTIKID